MSDIKSCIHRRRQYLVKEINDQKRSDLNYELNYVHEDNLGVRYQVWKERG